MAAGLTQEELAEKAHLSVDAISALERGTRQTPRKDTVALLAEALALSPDDRASLVAAARHTSQANGRHPPTSSLPSAPQLQSQDTAHAASILPVASDADAPNSSSSTVPRILEGVATAPDKAPIALQTARKKVALRGNALLFRVLAILLIGALLSVGAWQFAHRTTSPTQPPPAPESQQVLHVGLTALNTLDPQLVDVTADYETTQIIFPSLVQVDDHLNIENWAASKITISPDGRIYTFTLRHGLQWSNGAPITAADFAFAINRALTSCLRAPAASFLFPIADAEVFYNEPCVTGKPSGAISTLIGRSLLVVDDDTLVVHLHDPAAHFLDALSYPISWATPRALINQYGAQRIDHLADSGGLGGDLFKVVSWKQGSRLVLKRNDRFWGAHAKLREIDFVVTSDSKKMYADYLNGAGDISGLSFDQYASAKQRSDFHETSVLQMFDLGLNWSEPPFDDERIRQAFALAIDKATLNRDVFADIGQAPTNHLVPQGMPGYYPSLRGVDSTSRLTGNLTSASALAQAYANDHCGGQLSRCPPVVLAVVDSPLPSAFGVEIRAMWLRAMPGYPITIKTFPSSATPDALSEQAMAGKVQAWVFFWAADYPNPQDWLSNLLLPESTFNWGRVNLPEANALMRQADIDQNPSRRLSEYHQAEQLLVTAVAIIPLFQFTIFYVSRPYVTNYQVTALGQPSSNTWQRIYIAQH